MSTPNPREDISPSDHIIQLAATITKELKQDSYTNKQVRKALKEIIETAQGFALASNITGSLNRLETSISGIVQSQKQQFTNISKRIDKFENTKSWAQVAAKEALPPSLANGTPKTSPSLASTAPASPPDTRREDRDLVVNINKDTSDQSDEPPPTHAKVREEEKQTLEQLNKALQNSKICVLNDSRVGTVKKLPSGDWRLTMATAREAEVMKRHAQDWIAIIGANATIARPVYGVIMDGVRISTVDLDHPEKTIEELQKQNHRVLLPEREIKRLRWLQKPRKGKQYASLVMEFASPVDANVVINTNELFWQNETRRVRRAIRSATINQCFKCNKYGHRSTQCRNPETCGFCAEQHATAACPSRDDSEKATCANCRKKHPAWSVDCEMRKQEKTKVRERITRAEKYWREPTTASSVSPGPSSAPTNSSNSTSTTTKTPRTTTAGQKRPLAERTDNETNSAPKKKHTATGAKTIAESRQRKSAHALLVEEEENMNIDDDDCSGLSRSSNLSIASQDRRNLRQSRRKTQKSQEAIDIYEEL